MATAGGGRGKNKVVAGVLGILIGWTGAHNFYLGATTAGIIELVASIFTCGVAGVLGIVEGILVLVMPDADFDAKYNQRAPDPMEFVFTKPK